MNVAEKIFEVVVCGLKRESERRIKIAKDANENDLSFSLDDERELGTAFTLSQCLMHAGYLTRPDWYFYSSNHRLRPDITVWLPKAKRLVYFELKRVGQGWPYGRLREDMAKLRKVSEECCSNGFNGLFVVHFTQQKETFERLRVELKNLKAEYDDYEILGPTKFQDAGTADNGYHGAVSLLYSNELAKVP